MKKLHLERYQHRLLRRVELIKAWVNLMGNQACFAFEDMDVSILRMRGHELAIKCQRQNRGEQNHPRSNTGN
jgi:hypothetical protein